MQANNRSGPLRMTAVLTIFLLLSSAAGFLGCTSNDRQEDISGMASDEVLSWVQDWLDATTAGDSEALASMYVDNAVMDDLIAVGNQRREGSEEIASYVVQLTEEGVELGHGGKPLEVGDYVVQPVTVSYQGKDLGQAALMFLVDQENMILHQWVSGEFRGSEIEE